MSHICVRFVEGLVGWLKSFYNLPYALVLAAQGGIIFVLIVSGLVEMYGS